MSEVSRKTLCPRCDGEVARKLWFNFETFITEGVSCCNKCDFEARTVLKIVDNFDSAPLLGTRYVVKKKK